MTDQLYRPGSASLGPAIVVEHDRQDNGDLRTIASWRSSSPPRLLGPWHRHSQYDDAAVVEAIVPRYGPSGCGPAVGFPARSSSPMPYGTSRAGGDVGVARTGSRITRAMQPSAARGETSGPRPKRYDALARTELALCRADCSSRGQGVLRGAFGGIVTRLQLRVGSRGPGDWAGAGASEAWLTSRRTSEGLRARAAGPRG